MDKPKTLIDLEVDEQERIKIENFLFDWYKYFRSNPLMLGELLEVPKLQLGISKEDFKTRYQLYLELSEVSRGVLEHLQKLKKFSRRGETSQEIVANFNGQMSRRAVLKQLERLKTWGAIKELRVKVGKHEAIFYEAK